MVLSLFNRVPSPGPAKFNGLAHPEYPIEQTVRGTDVAMQALLLRMARRGNQAMDDARWVGASQGVRILGRSEGALKYATANLVGRHARRVAIEPPRIRYVQGARVLEP